MRWLAPGDDLAHPFARPERLCHAESSGASAVAAGALLLVLAINPTLRLEELEAAVSSTLTPAAHLRDTEHANLADSWDALPWGKDRDGHDAKCGYGRIHARLACLVASDPICAALVAMGEEDAAWRWFDARASVPEMKRSYSRRLARRGASLLLRNASLAHPLRAVIRHLRLTAAVPERDAAHGDGALARHITLLLRHTFEHDRAMPHMLDKEVGRLTALLSAPHFGDAVLAAAARVFVEPRSTEPAECLRATRELGTDAVPA